MNHFPASLRAAFAVAVAAFLVAMAPVDGVLSKSEGMDVVNTSSLTTDVDGYEGPTPVRIFIKGGKIVKVEALPNDETPEYFARVERFLLKKWKDMPVKKAATEKVDGVTGATFSSDAIITNVQRGAEYYNKNARGTGRKR